MAAGGWDELNFWRRSAALFAAVLMFAGCVGGSASSSSSLSPDEQAFLDGQIARCNEGGYSDNDNFSATCSSAGDVAEWLGEFGRCGDGRIIALNEDASCDDNAGFDAVMPAGFAPDASAADVARCNDGTYSDNDNFSATCSSAGGIDEWLTQYGRCDDGVVIVMSDMARCADGFDELIPDDVELVASSNDLARCVNGTFSDNTDLRAICSANGGVAEWLADYVECVDGDIVELNQDTSCDIAALRPGYTPPTTTTTTSTPTSTTTTVPTPAVSDVPQSVDDASTALARLRVADPDVGRELYERDRYDGDGWADLDGDCISTRHELLAATSLTAAVFDTSGCRVIAGKWLDPYDGSTYTSADQVSIDHLVALAAAHRAGAWKWDNNTKNRFSNDEDPGHLVVVGRETNQSKADKTPDQWLPPDPNAQCQYAIDWVDTKARYELTITAAERTSLTTVLDSCDSQSTFRTDPSAAFPAPVVVITTPTTTTTTTIVATVGPGVVALTGCHRRAESVTIANTGGTPVSLSGYQLHDNGNKHSTGLGGYGTLEPGQQLVILTGPDAVAGEGRVVWKNQNVWNNDGDIANLIAPDGTATTKAC